jgi:tetratricopeptide (TPR) repeat protein
LEEAIFQYSEALRVNPRFARAENNWGVALMKSGQWEEGAAHCRAALKIEPKNLEAAYNLGTAEMHSGRLKEAMAAFSQAITIDPKLVDAHYGIGLAQLQQGKRKDAEEHFSTVLRLEPNNFDAHDQLADLLASQGQLSEAIPHLNAAIAAKPSPMLHFRLASILEAQGKVAEAIAGYRQALQMNPDQAEALNNLAWLLASHPNANMRDGEEAVRLAERACELTQRKQPMLIGTLAAAYAEAGRFTNAVATAEQARNVATEMGQKEIADKNGELLELYRSNKAFHQSSP